MEDTLWNYFTQFGTTVTMPKDVALNDESDSRVADYVYLLEDGICALTSITKQGEEKVYLYFRPHRLIGFNQYVVSPEKLDASSPSFFVTTRTTCVLNRIPSSAFLELVKKDPQVNALLIKTLADNYSDALNHFHYMQEESAVVRVCHLLLELSQFKDSVRYIPRFFTYAELAKYLGCHSVTVSRIMAKLKQKGYISKCPLGIAIDDEDGIMELMNEKVVFKY